MYRTEEEKFRNAAKEIKELHEKGQPVLVGTVSVEKSEKLSGILKKMGVRHEVLNAKNHEREASIVAQAGRKGAVTVSTNMAGRGTDILLGGNPEFLATRAPAQGEQRSRSCRLRVGSRAQEWDSVYQPIQGADRRRSTTKWWSWAACTSSAPNATNRAASTISFADAPDARAIPAARASISRCKTT